MQVHSKNVEKRNNYNLHQQQETQMSHNHLRATWRMAANYQETTNQRTNWIHGQRKQNSSCKIHCHFRTKVEPRGFCAWEIFWKAKPKITVWHQALLQCFEDHPYHVIFWTKTWEGDSTLDIGPSTTHGIVDISNSYELLGNFPFCWIQGASILSGRIWSLPSLPLARAFGLAFATLSEALCRSLASTFGFPFAAFASPATECGKGKWLHRDIL